MGQLQGFSGLALVGLSSNIANRANTISKKESPFLAGFWAWGPQGGTFKQEVLGRPKK